ncbi:unnamed protein product [Owenia fusiformis]|uniref:Uncharacterized protein n=1 Tax=Owenia fusiformis TaxID=6347 RepID=A0A8S4P552_OWEFU|nr:unnamed protein product [Owenia fusiformis]
MSCMQEAYQNQVQKQSGIHLGEREEIDKTEQNLSISKMLNKIILGGLALVCLVNIAGSAPVDEYGENLDDIESVLETEDREVNEDELEFEIRGTAWRFFKAKESFKATKSGDLKFKKNAAILLQLDYLPRKNMKVKGYKRINNGKKWISGKVNTKYLNYYGKSIMERKYSEPSNGKIKLLA